MKALIERVEAVALNIIRVTLEDGSQYTLQELDHKLRVVRYEEG